MEPLVILDNGHGKETMGKASPLWSDGTQLLEYEFNRDVVKRIVKGLTTLDIKCVVLVPEAIDIYLRVRCDRANAIFKNNPSAFLISVHGNAGGGKGWEVFTSPGQTKSDKIASILFDAAKNELKEFRMRSDYCDEDPDKESEFTILVKTDCPAVLTENLFYDNEVECKFMMSDEGRDRIAKLHIMGIQNYIKTLKP